MRWIPFHRSKDPGAQDTTLSAPVGNMDFSGFTPSIETENSADWLGMWAGNGQDHIALENWLGVEIPYSHIKLFMGANGFTQLFSNFTADQFNSAGLSDRVKLSAIWDLYPNDKSDPEWDNIQNGVYDSDFATLAQRFVDAGYGDGNVIFRLWHEADIPNSSSNSHSHTFRSNGFEIGTQPDDYIAAWRYVHDLMESQPNFTAEWQYSINGPAGAQATENGTEVIELGYPGDNYVTRVSVGHYDRGGFRVCDFGFGPAQTKLDYVKDFAVAHGKKMDVAEWGLWAVNPVEGNTPGCGDDPAFITESHDWMAALSSTERGYILYFNDISDTRIDSVNGPSQYPNSETEFLRLFGG